MSDIILRMFYQGWPGLLRTVLVGVFAYLSLIVVLRVTGKRTLSKMNAFDLVVTVALGSTLATIILSKDVALAEGLVAYGVLIGMQFVITWLSVRSKTITHLVKSEPKMLVYRGEYLSRAMLNERVNEEEILAALRSQGVSRLEDVKAVVLETDGKFSVVEFEDGEEDGQATTFKNVEFD